MATPWFVPDWIQKKIDDQRVERLGQCRSLERVWRECRENQQQQASPKKRRWLSSSPAPEQQQQQQQQQQRLEDFPMGIRMVRYFDWRNVQAPVVADNTTSCVREEHAVWACRAVGLQCGPDLVQLRDCFRNHNRKQVLAQHETAYETNNNKNNSNEVSSSGNEPVCLSMQASLGECVRRNAQGLEARMRERKKA